MFRKILKSKRCCGVLVLILVLLALQTRVSWALREPDVTASIKKGEVNWQDDMLANVQYGWYPGQVKEGLLRIQNNDNGAIRLDTFSVNVSLIDAFGSKIDLSKYDYEIYSVHFPNAEGPINLAKGAFVDLDYRVEMNRRCGNELQGSKANIELIAQVSGP